VITDEENKSSDDLANFEMENQREYQVIFTTLCKLRKISQKDDDYDLHRLSVKKCDHFYYSIEIVNENSQTLYHKSITSELSYEFNSNERLFKWIDIEKANEKIVIYECVLPSDTFNEFYSLFFQALFEVKRKVFMKKFFINWKGTNLIFF